MWSDADSKQNKRWWYNTIPLDFDGFYYKFWLIIIKSLIVKNVECKGT